MIKTNYKSNDKHPLSSFWSHTQKITKNRLNFFGKGITCIDKIQALGNDFLTSVKQIDLSHNALNKLQNLKQFRYIEVLNISHNHITDGRQLTKLKHLKNLKTIMVKGNPFLKSQENITDAFLALIPLNTDIETLSQNLDTLFCEALRKFTVLKVKQQYHRQIETNISFSREFNLEMAQSGINHFTLYRRIITQKIESVVEQLAYRKEVFDKIMSENGQQTNQSCLLHFESKKQLLTAFDSNVRKFITKMEDQTFQINKKIAEKEDIYQNIAKKVIAKQKKQITISEDSLESRLQSPKYVALIDNSNRKWETSQINFEETEQKKDYGKHSRSPFKNQNKLFAGETFVQASSSIPEEKFQTYYYNMMMKHNPVYHLLYSPLQSLKNKEKDMLIEALSSHLKEKTRALMKAEKGKGDFTQMKKKYDALDMQFIQAQKTFEEYKKSMNDQIKLLEMSNSQKQTEIEEIGEKLNFYEQQNSVLEEKLLSLNEKMSENRLFEIKTSHKLQKIQNEEEVFEKIQLLREKRLRREMLKKIENRASILYKHKMNKAKLDAKSKQNLMRECFQALKYQTQFSHFSSSFISSKRLKIKTQSMAQMINNAKFGLKMKRARRLYKNIKSNEIIQNMWRFKNKRTEDRNKVENMREKIARRCLRDYFGDWKMVVDVVKQFDLEQKVDLWYQHKLQKKMLTKWLVFLKQPVYKQAQVTVDRKSSNIRHFLLKIQENYFDNKEIQLKSLNLSLFLTQNKKIQGYYRFKSNVIYFRELRENKQKRVAKELRAKYFYQFAICAQAAKEERQVEEKKIRQIQLTAKSRLFLTLKGNNSLTKHKKEHLSNIFWRVQNIKQSLKELMLEDKIRTQRIKQVFTNFFTSSNKKMRNKNKRQELELYLICNKWRKSQEQQAKKQFLSSLRSPIKEKKKLGEYLAAKYLKMMMKYFGHWRVNMHQDQIEMLKGRIRQFGPEIDEITRRQKTTFEEKLVLMEVIESKQRTIRNYMKQVEEAEYKVRTKEDKYRKLKMYCQEQDKDHILNSKLHQTTFLGESRVPQHDYDTPYYEEDNELFKSFKHF